MTGTRTSRRYVALLKQMLAEGQTQTDIASKLGVSQTYVSKLVTGVRTGVRSSTVDRAVDRLGISPAYFHDGEADVDYHDYLGGQPATTYELDSAEGIHEVETYLADLEAMGADVDPEHAAALREFRPSAYQPDREMVMKVYKDIVRLSRGKTAERPDLEPHKLRPGRVKLGGDGEG